MKNLVLYAPPAAGKGTICELLKKDFNYNVLSIGQVLRNQRNPETEVGRAIIESQDKGVLTPDDIVLKALKEELAKFEGKAIIIEGYPRNIEQAKMLDTIFDNYIVVNLSVERELAKKRTLGRVNCPKCNKIYNVYFQELSPKNGEICDVCGSKLNIRSDDNEESFNVRYDVYEQNAPAILDYYNNKGILYVVDSKSSDYVYNQIEPLIKNA